MWYLMKERHLAQAPDAVIFFYFGELLYYEQSPISAAHAAGFGLTASFYPRLSAWG
jgi:hypothetical protein